MIKTIRKYASLYSAMFKASFISDLEYRANFFTRIITDIFWYFAQVMTFEVIYKHTEKIGDWNIAQMRVFLGVLFISDGLYMMFLHENIENISEKVRKGDLDLLLAKPVNSQFMLSLQRTSTAYIGNLILGSSWLFYNLFHQLICFPYHLQYTATQCSSRALSYNPLPPWRGIHDHPCHPPSPLAYRFQIA